MLQTPRQRPGRHRHVRWYFALLDLLHQIEFLLYLSLILLRADIIRMGELRAGLVFATQQPAGQRNASQHAQILFPTQGQQTLLRRTVQTIIDDLNHAGTHFAGPTGLVKWVNPTAYGKSQMANFTRLNLSLQHRP
jgi:hypothetical protein